MQRKIIAVMRSSLPHASRQRCGDAGDGQGATNGTERTVGAAHVIDGERERRARAAAAATACDVERQRENDIAVLHVSIRDAADAHATDATKRRRGCVHAVRAQPSDETRDVVRAARPHGFGVGSAREGGVMRMPTYPEVMRCRSRAAQSDGERGAMRARAVARARGAQAPESHARM